VEEVGPLPNSASAVGTVRETTENGDAWNYLTHESGAIARLPVGRKTAGRHLGRQAATVLRPGAVERADPILSERLSVLTTARATTART